MTKIYSYRYLTVDVFTDKPLEGNPLAVFPDAAGIDDTTMQKIAKELNLSETTFVVPATRKDCAVRVRIFTPGREMDFAGHPTIGTGFVLIKEGIIPKNTRQFVLEEKVGPVPVSVETSAQQKIWLRTPPISEGITFDRAICAHTLDLDLTDLFEISPQFLTAGNPTIFIALKNKNAVDRAKLNSSGLNRLRETFPGPFCIFIFTPTLEGAYSRMLAAPEYGIFEDPATGSSTGPLAVFMMKHGLIPGASGTRFISEQGTKMGRRSILHVHIVGENGKEGIDVGGNVVPVAEAVMKF
jgi:trans-2,3-dihydro-3-hydroxyanthranilate isomerase